MPELLTPKAEEIFNKILFHKNANGTVDTDYWAEQFASFSEEQDSIARSCFKELSDSGLIHTFWADDVPYYIDITSKGLSYFDLKDRFEEEKKEEERRKTFRDIVISVVGIIGKLFS